MSASPSPGGRAALAIKIILIKHCFADLFMGHDIMAPQHIIEDLVECKTEAMKPQSLL